MAQDKETFLERWSRVKREQGENAAAPEKPAVPERAPELPPLDQLTPESDFAPFMHPKVDAALRRAALKKLFADPRFNVPDPFEPFSGDWTGGEAIPDEMLATLNQARTLLFSEKEKQKQDEQPQKAAEEEPKEDEPGRKDA